MHPRARHSQECFLPPRGGFNLRCTRERDIPKNVFFLREKVLIYDAPSLPRKDNRFDQELPSIRGSKVWRKGLVQWRGLMIWSRSWFRTPGKGRERVTGFPYISPISSGLRWRGERYIPKNVFFLREEVLIYDAPSLPRKDNRFDQELPSIGGSKVWRKGSRSVAWLDGRKNVLFLRWRGERYIPKNVFFLREEVLILSMRGR